MARRQTGSGAGDTAKPITGGKSFKADTGKLDSLKVGETLTGFFLGAKTITITDIRTKLPKPLFVLKLREDNEGEKVLKVPCAAMMLQSWDDMVDEYGNGDEAAAIDKLRGKKMTINRSESTQTRGGDELGVYEIIVWE